MGARRWGNAVPNAVEPHDAAAEIVALKALLVEKGVLTDAEAGQTQQPPRPIGGKKLTIG